MRDQLAPMVQQEKVVGQADVMQVFPLRSSQPSAVAGCRIREGSVQSSQQWRVLRAGEVVYNGGCESLRRHKQEVSFLLVHLFYALHSNAAFVVIADDYKMLLSPWPTADCM